MLPQLEQVRRGHQEILHALARLEADSVRDLAQALEAWEAFARRRLEPLLREEEVLVGPLLDRVLPREAFSSGTLQYEHDTMRGLLETLAEVSLRLRGGEDVEADARGLVSDLSLLLRDHIRREDDVIHPLVRLLGDPGHA